MKALILAAGSGKRLRSVTNGRNKCMLPFAGKPIIQHSLENAIRAGASELVITVGYQAEEITAHFGNQFQGLAICYVYQEQPCGMVDALACSRSFIGGSDFLLFLGDEILQNPRHKAMIDLFYTESLFAVCGVVFENSLQEVQKTYGVLMDCDGRVQRLIEKPQVPPNGMRGTGNCLFRAGLLDFIDQTPVNPLRGEKEFTDLIQCAIDHALPVKTVQIADRYINVNSPEDMSIAERSISTPPASSFLAG